MNLYYPKVLAHLLTRAGLVPEQLLEVTEMIVDMVTGDILVSDCKHVVFAVNCDGDNYHGFAGLVARRFRWPKLTYDEPVELGQIFHKKVGRRTFHAVACYSLEIDHSWDETASALQLFLDLLDADDESIGIVQNWGGEIDEMTDADPEAILGGAARSTKRVKVFRPSGD